MNYREDSIFQNNRNTFILSMSVMMFIYLFCIAAQVVIDFDPLSLFLSIFLIIITFMFNITLGNPGFGMSVALNIVQLSIYIYTYARTGNILEMYLVGLALLSLIITMCFQLFVGRIDGRFDGLRRELSKEKDRRISSETEALLKETMLRTSLIVKHNENEDRSIASDAMELSESGFLDRLTTLPNRARIISHLEELINTDIKQEDTFISLIYVSVAESAIFSRNLGHRTLDLFTQCLAHRLREYANPADIVGRVAGNEFVIVCNRSMSRDLTEGYIKVLMEAMVNGSGTDLSGSIISPEDVFAGFAVYPDNGRFPGELVNNAEAAMRTAMKRRDGSRIMFASENTGISGRAFGDLNLDEVENIIDLAIQAGEIKNVYQPRYDRNMKLTGFETFVRWISPVYGNISTYELLSVSEKTGQIHKLGFNSMKEAFSILRELNDLDPSLTMTVNLSSVQIERESISGHIADIIRETGCSSSNIILDIPEEVLLSGYTDMKGALEKLSSLNIVMALDNFGRGYSSLNNIPLLPIELVKLDGHFTSDLSEGSAERALTASIIELLLEIDIPVDATGVGTKEQFDTLVSFGCKYFQGKYLCEPLPAGKLQEFTVSCLSK